MAGSLTLKWGSIKGWDHLDKEALAAVQKWANLGMSTSAMMQKRSADHIEAICELIQLVDEPIWNDWDNVGMTREEATTYVRGYDAS